MMQAWGRLDRALLLRWPTLWLARIHVVTVAGVILGLLMGLVGFALAAHSSQIRTDARGRWEVSWGTGPLTVASMLAAMASFMLTLYWAYLQLRSKNLVPSFGRRWIFPVYAYSMVVLNLGPFLMVNLCYWRMSQIVLPYAPHHHEIFPYDGLLVPVLLIAMIAAELLAVVTVAGSVSGRLMLLAAGGILLSIFLVTVFFGTQSAYVVAIVVLITGYVLTGLLAFVTPLSNLRLVLISTSIFHLATPLFPLLIMFISYGGRGNFDIGNTRALETLLLTTLGYLVVSYPLERRLARLRATPA